MVLMKYAFEKFHAIARLMTICKIMFKDKYETLLA